MGKNVDPELYEFLKEHETGLYESHQTGLKEIIAYVHVRFCDLEDFAEIVGSGQFDDGGLEVSMYYRTICIDINDIIEDLGHRLSDYENCFNESDWKEYEEEIKQMEAE